VKLNVIDNKFSENSFEKEHEHIFPLLQEIANNYGDDIVIDEWAVLLNCQKIELALNRDHIVSIQIAR
jgi:hypothetical protein